MFPLSSNLAILNVRLVAGTGILLMYCDPAANNLSSWDIPGDLLYAIELP